MQKTLKKLKTYFEENENVILAFIFGSSVRGFEGKDSDFDIGVYLLEKKEEDQIWSETSKIVRKEIDLVALNDAPATLTSNIFKTGIPLVIKDRKLFWYIYLTKTLEAEDMSMTPFEPGEEEELVSVAVSNFSNVKKTV